MPTELHTTQSEMDKATALFSPQEKLDLVQRIIKSPHFARSSAMRAFLLYITERSIANQYAQIKEQTIGVEVLGRRPSYDPADDNIVRVRAHELRQRLEKYYAAEGQNERILLTVPKGNYRPEFAPRPDVVPPAEAEPAPLLPLSTSLPVPSAESVQAVVQSTPWHRSQWLWASLCANLILIVGIIFIYARPQARPTDPLATGPFKDFWAQIYSLPEHSLKIIPADTGLALWQDLSGHNVNLGDYLSHNFLSLSDEHLREIALRRSTSPADLLVSTHLALIARAFGAQSTPLYARDIDARSFPSDNVAILGSHRSNPWIEVFEPQLNFVLDSDPATGSPSLLNRSPMPGEQPRYSIPTTLDVEGGEQKEFRSYGLVALLHPCNSSHFAIVIEGLNMQATEAAGEMVTDAHALSSLLQSIHHQSGTDVAPFEALIQIKSLPGGYAAPQVIAFRNQANAPCKSTP